jgi:hypothetical protein
MDVAVAETARVDKLMLVVRQYGVVRVINTFFRKNKYIPEDLLHTESGESIIQEILDAPELDPDPRSVLSQLI